MSTRLRSHCKINLGLAIGPIRPDGFHALTTLYQTLALHDVVTISASRLNGSKPTSIRITCNHPEVPTDARNTAWRIVELALATLKISAQVHIDIDKRLPVQGGLGAGSANAAAALIGLERELGLAWEPGLALELGLEREPGLERELGLDLAVPGLSAQARLALAAQVGSDVPLFLLGGSVLGTGRGEEVSPLPELPSYECIVATAAVSVSTPQAFRDWDALLQLKAPRQEPADAALLCGSSSVLSVSSVVSSFASEPPGLAKDEPGGLTKGPNSDTMKELSRSYASAYGAVQSGSPHSSGVSPQRGDLAENPLLALVRTGIENDFEQVVFPQYPLLGDIKRILAVPESDQPEQSAVYAALSGSGSAVFGLFATTEAATSAQRRLRARGITAHHTHMLSRTEYWQDMLLA